MTKSGRNRNRNKPITSKEIKSGIKNLLPQKTPRPDGFTGEFYKTFKGIINTNSP